MLLEIKVVLFKYISKTLKVEWEEGDPPQPINLDQGEVFPEK